MKDWRARTMAATRCTAGGQPQSSFIFATQTSKIGGDFGMPVCWLPCSKYRCTSTLTSWEGEGGELGEEVAWPVTLVLTKREANLLSNAGGKVGVGLGGEAFAGLRTCRCQQQAEYLRTLQSEKREACHSC